MGHRALSRTITHYHALSRTITHYHALSRPVTHYHARSRTITRSTLHGSARLDPSKANPDDYLRPACRWYSSATLVMSTAPRRTSQAPRGRRRGAREDTDLVTASPLRFVVPGFEVLQPGSTSVRWCQVAAPCGTVAPAGGLGGGIYVSWRGEWIILLAIKHYCVRPR